MTQNCPNANTTGYRVHCGLRIRERSATSCPRTTHNRHHTNTFSTNQKQARGDTIPTQLEVALFGHAMPEIPPQWKTVAEEVMETVRMRWAKSTTQARNRLFNELVAAQMRSKGVPLQTLAAFIVQQKQVTIQTKLNYAKNLHTILRSMGEDVPLLWSYVAGLRAMGAEIPNKQATPMTREVLESIVCPLEVKVALLLAWKTASRIDEIARIDSTSIVCSNPSEVIIWFGSRTKTSRSKPFMPQLLQVVTGDWTQFLHENLPAALLNWPSAGKIAKYIPKPYTMHSIKHGAANVLIAAAAQRRLDPQLIPLVLKHKTPQPLAEVTLRYTAGNKADAARALRSAEATQLL